ncbi:hypothetical protein SAMN05421504_105614 [Amycolatopsis xylanica]|uniref:Uncharacterized protein n=1 Tax=Amycolatopsis xylanica TaxID=589385 RepID=A0A1H3K228_9PSEU|nr:hypothetical protein [Amycolatopsis xylanica]SDY45815.1 hypothetical protein SAMN05421504_105614 [Amycolatopsis xylanica]
MRRLQRWWSTVFVAALAAMLLGTVPASATPSYRDVFIRDNAADVAGAEPSAGAVWSSPDIWVCPPWDAGCAVDHNPIVGQLNWVHVKLNRKLGAETDVTGTLRLYYTAMGGAANWGGDADPFDDWTKITDAFGVIVPPGGTELVLPWNGVPGPGHYCLLARWDSAADTMTTAEGANTLTNTRNNNNIGWHNVNTVELPQLQPQPEPFMIGNPWREGDFKTNLVLAADGKPFVGPGRIVVDLGPELAARWKQAGQRGVGVRPAGDTTVEIVDGKFARIDGLVLKSRERVPAKIVFTAGTAAAGGQFVVRVNQTDGQGVDVGGVEYRLTVK